MRGRNAAFKLGALKKKKKLIEICSPFLKWLAGLLVMSVKADDPAHRLEANTTRSVEFFSSLRQGQNPKGHV